MAAMVDHVAAARDRSGCTEKRQPHLAAHLVIELDVSRPFVS
jgi:hypothetical protein